MNWCSLVACLKPRRAFLVSGEGGGGGGPSSPPSLELFPCSPYVPPPFPLSEAASPGLGRGGGALHPDDCDRGLGHPHG